MLNSKSLISKKILKKVINIKVKEFLTFFIVY
jgi:hypothetical protein